MKELRGFGMKNSLALPSLAIKYFNSLRDENVAPIYTYNEFFVRYFVRESKKGGRCSALNQYYKSKISDEVFNNFSKELNINGNVCEMLEKHFEYTNKHRKLVESDNDKEVRTKHITKELNKLPIHKKLQKLDANNDVMMDNDGNCL